MQTNQYEFRENYAYKNGKRIIGKMDLLCECEQLAREVYRQMCGNTDWFVCHYDHLTCAELVSTLKKLVEKHEQLTK